MRLTEGTRAPLGIGVFLALASVAGAGRAQIWDRIQKQVQKADEIQGKVQAKVQKVYQPLTVEQEKAVGREVAAKVIAFFKLYKNDALTRYVNLVGATVAAQAERQDIQYHFAVLDSNDPNAFSAPGGYVFITRGAIALCGDESELAGVLAHEVGHVAAKHVVHIIERDNTMRAAMEETSARVPGSPYLDKISKNILVKIIDQGLAPDDEYDADARAMKYAHAAGYPADGLDRFLKNLDAATNQGAQSFWTRTHPPAKNRNTRIEMLISMLQWEDADRPKLGDRFAAETVGLKPKAGA